MGLDLVTLKNCEVKDQVPQNELLNHIKNRNRAYHVYNMIVSKGKSHDDALNTEFTHSLQTGEGVVNQNVKVSTLIEQTSFLEQLGLKCEGCSVSQNKPFGCIGYISYPISRKCEIWLSGLAEKAYKKGWPHSATIVFIKDQNIKGDRIKGMRAHGRTFFESSKPVEIILSKSLFKKDTITSDQLLEMTFFNGEMRQRHIELLLMLYGDILSISSGDIVGDSVVIDEEANARVKFRLELPPDADESMSQFHTYFQHLFVALTNEHAVYMD